jgi:hypothetical protein
VLVIRELSEANARELVVRLPATVRELGLHGLRGYGTPPAAHWLIDDRFDTVEIAHLAHDDLNLPAALARTNRVRLLLRDTQLRLPHRVELGRQGDAAFIARDEPRAHVVSRHGLIALERAHGPLGIRAVLARELAESYAVAFGIGVVAGGNDLVRRGRVWTLRGNERYEAQVDGTRVAPGTLVKLDHGVRVRIGTPDEWIFVKNDLRNEFQKLH